MAGRLIWPPCRCQPPSQNVPASAVLAPFHRPCRMCRGQPPLPNMPGPTTLAEHAGTNHPCRTCRGQPPLPNMPGPTTLAEHAGTNHPCRTCRGQPPSPNVPGPAALAERAGTNHPCRTCRGQPPSPNVPGPAALAERAGAGGAGGVGMFCEGGRPRRIRRGRPAQELWPGTPVGGEGGRHKSYGPAHMWGGEGGRHKSYGPAHLWGARAAGTRVMARHTCGGRGRPTQELWPGTHVGGRGRPAQELWPGTHVGGARAVPGRRMGPGDPTGHVGGLGEGSTTGHRDPRPRCRARSHWALDRGASLDPAPGWPRPTCVRVSHRVPSAVSPKWPVSTVPRCAASRCQTGPDDLPSLHVSGRRVFRGEAGRKSWATAALAALPKTPNAPGTGPQRARLIAGRGPPMPNAPSTGQRTRQEPARSATRVALVAEQALGRPCPTRPAGGTFGHGRGTSTLAHGDSG